MTGFYVAEFNNQTWKVDVGE
uniref:Uncharacterized protein n=1 Tax=Rhizophora mucronata TaxID=61149 RepID=A0A2P2Q2F9_RHIMU